MEHRPEQQVAGQQSIRGGCDSAPRKKSSQCGRNEAAGLRLGRDVAEFARRAASSLVSDACGVATCHLRSLTVKHEVNALENLQPCASQSTLHLYGSM